jgi:hypothetical protein
MRSTIILALTFFLLGSTATGDEVSAPVAGLSRKLVTDTLSATLPKAQPVSDVFASVKVTVVLGEDE